jgi:hypothetical protein
MLPPGTSPTHNETGWLVALAKFTPFVDRAWTVIERRGQSAKTTGR